MLWVVNVLGGVGVLGSYAWGLLTQDDPSRLWGTIPEAARPIYSLCMPFAAAGYLTVLAWAHRNPDPRMVGAMSVMLAASTLWMPLSFAALENAALLPLVQGVLAVTAAASLSMGVLVVQGRASSLRWAALAGIVAFSWQTVVLDAMIWPRFFG